MIVAAHKQKTMSDLFVIYSQSIHYPEETSTDRLYLGLKPRLHYNVLGTTCAWNGATFFRHGTARLSPCHTAHDNDTKKIVRLFYIDR